MNEPEKKIETPSSVGNEPETHDTPATPAAANSNDAKSEPVVGVSPVVDISGGKKDPVTAVPVAPVKDAKPEVVVPPAVVTPAPANTNEAPVAPAAETKPVEAPAPVAGETPPPAAPEAPAATDAAPKKKGWLQQAYNFAAGALISGGASFAAKSAVGVALGVAGASTLTTILVSGFAVGAAVTVARDAWDSHKEGKTLKEYFSKAHWKGFLTSKKTWLTFGISTGGAMLGSAIALGIHNGTIQEAWNNFFGHGSGTTTVIPPVVAPVEVTQPVVPVEVTQPVVPVEVTQPVIPVETAPIDTVVAAPICLTPGEHFSQLIDGHSVSSRVTDAMARAASTNATVAAQGSKDLAYFAFNGFDGVPKDHNVAIELFKQAADAGNAQAKVDLVYMQYHGLGGVAADKTAAIATMKTLPGARAANFIANWGGSGKVAAAAFSSDTVLKGMAVGCPTL